MSSLAIYLYYSLSLLGELLLNGVGSGLYIGMLCTGMLVLILAVLVTCIVTLKRRKEKMRQPPPNTLNTNTAPPTTTTELHTMATPIATPPPAAPQHHQLGACHGCVGCDGGEGYEVNVEVKLPHACSCKSLDTLSPAPHITTTTPSTTQLSKGYYNHPRRQGNRTDSVAIGTNMAYGSGANQAPPPPTTAPPPPYPGLGTTVSIPEYDYIVDRT